MFKTAEETLKTTSINAARQENLLRDQVMENEKNQKEIQKLMLKQLSMKGEADKMNARMEKTRKELFEKNRSINDMAKEIQRYVCVLVMKD